MGCLDDIRIVAGAGFQIDDVDPDNIQSEDARFDEYQLRSLVGIVSHRFQQLLVNRNKSLKLQPHIIQAPNCATNAKEAQNAFNRIGASAKYS